MPILTTATRTAIDTQAIGKGDLIRAKYRSWTRAINGIVASADESVIRVLYIGTGGNVTNYFTITADELADGEWTVSWSTDFSDVSTHAPEPETDGNGGEGAVE